MLECKRSSTIEYLLSLSLLCGISDSRDYREWETKGINWPPDWTGEVLGVDRLDQIRLPSVCHRHWHRGGTGLLRGPPGSALLFRSACLPSRSASYVGQHHREEESWTKGEKEGEHDGWKRSAWGVRWHRRQYGLDVRSLGARCDVIQLGHEGKIPAVEFWVIRCIVQNFRC